MGTWWFSSPDSSRSRNEEAVGSEEGEDEEGGCLAAAALREVADFSVRVEVSDALGFGGGYGAERLAG